MKFRLLVLLITISSLFALDAEVQLTGLLMMGYQNGQIEESADGNESTIFINQYSLKRGYLNMKRRLDKNFLARLTPDITVDEEGDGLGDVELRLKYCYLQYIGEKWGSVTAPKIEFGLVHRPWVDYEYSFNSYRFQASMFLERVKVLDSADFGVMIQGQFGDEMPKDFQNRVNKKFPGRFGSFALGIYNGGGYHAIEANLNKTIEYRLSIRPLPDMIPGLQISLHGADGAGNKTDEPAWKYNAVYVGHDSRMWTVSGHYYAGKGDYKGSDEFDRTGYSLFSDLRFLDRKLAFMCRYDYFDKDSADDYSSVLGVAGLSYNVSKAARIMVSYQVYEKDTNLETITETLGEVSVEVKI